jgi:hypothetical protein
VEQKDIVALLEALCERPLADGQAEPSAELQAFCRAAAQALSQTGEIPAGFDSDSFADADRLTAALATVLSGAEVESARRMVEEAVLQSAPARLDAQAAVAFLDAIEQSPQAAPAHLVEEILAADRAAVTGASRRDRAGTGLWARRWRMAAAGTVLLVAGAASWSVYWQPTNPSNSDAVLPVAKTTHEPPAVAAAPPAPAVATTQPCEPPGRLADAAKPEPNKAAKARTGKAVRAGTSEPAGAPKSPDTAVSADCAAPGHQFADRPGEEGEAVAARQRAEAARQAAATQAAAADKSGAARAGREGDPVQADRSMFGASGQAPAAAMQAPAASAPPAVPAVRPAAPYGVR